MIRLHFFIFPSKINIIDSSLKLILNKKPMYYCNTVVLCNLKNGLYIEFDLTFVFQLRWTLPSLCPTFGEIFHQEPPLASSCMILAKVQGDTCSYLLGELLGESHLGDTSPNKHHLHPSIFFI